VTSGSRVVARLMRLYCHLQLPGWRRWLGRVLNERGWQGRRIARIRPHGFKMELDLSEPWERWSYLSGRYYEMHTQMLMAELLDQDECLVDVGANIGQIALIGAWKVGPNGCVIAFEPNPDVFSRLNRNVLSNGLQDRVHVQNIALGSQAGTLALSVPTQGSGGGTLGRLGAEYSGQPSRQYQVRVAVGDEICDRLQRPMVLKIDVEGFETSVIKGLQSTIRRLRPAMLVEAWPDHLTNAGSSIEELFAVAVNLGYEVYAVHTRLRVRGVTASARLSLTKITAPDDGLTDDILWLHPDSWHRKRVARFIEQ
jgi:FkbM family methyltransferase